MASRRSATTTGDGGSAGPGASAVAGVLRCRHRHPRRHGRQRTDGRARDEPLTPVPQPQAAPPAGSLRNRRPGRGPAPSGDAPASAPPDGAGTRAGRTRRRPASSGARPPRPAAPARPRPPSRERRLQRRPPPSSQAPAPDDPPRGNAAGTQAVTAYYVLLDDGGSRGVRFGCNDSLVGVRRSNAESAEPLPAAIGALLDGSEPPHRGCLQLTVRLNPGLPVRHLRRHHRHGLPVRRDPARRSVRHSADRGPTDPDRGVGGGRHPR